MVRPNDIAQQIRNLIRDRRLKPGDAMPSERALAKLLETSYGMVRLANDQLCKENVVVRSHGQGTFVATPPVSTPKRLRRLGMMYVDPGYARQPSQSLVFAAQSIAQKRGYELVLDMLSTEDLFLGQLPEMISRRSVDAILVDGWVTPAHMHFFRQQAILHMVMGNRGLGDQVPHVRPNTYELVRKLTEELFDAGRDTVWMDADPAYTEYIMGIEMFRGYRAGVQSSLGEHAPLHLCRIEPDRVSRIVDMFADMDLSNTAMIVQNWAWPLVAETLIPRNPTAAKMLFVPLPYSSVLQSSPTSNHVQWQLPTGVSMLPAAAVNGMIDILEGQTQVMQSVCIETSFTLEKLGHKPAGQVFQQLVPFGPSFEADFHASGANWLLPENEVTATGEGDSASAGTSSTSNNNQSKSPNR